MEALPAAAPTALGGAGVGVVARRGSRGYSVRFFDGTVTDALPPVQVRAMAERFSRRVVALSEVAGGGAAGVNGSGGGGGGGGGGGEGGVGSDGTHASWDLARADGNGIGAPLPIFTCAPPPRKKRCVSPRGGAAAAAAPASAGAVTAGLDHEQMLEEEACGAESGGSAVAVLAVAVCGFLRRRRWRRQQYQQLGGGAPSGSSSGGGGGGGGGGGVGGDGCGSGGLVSFDELRPLALLHWVRGQGGSGRTAGGDAAVALAGAVDRLREALAILVGAGVVESRRLAIGSGGGAAANHKDGKEEEAEDASIVAAYRWCGWPAGTSPAVQEAALAGDAADVRRAVMAKRAVLCATARRATVLRKLLARNSAKQLPARAQAEAGQGNGSVAASAGGGGGEQRVSLPFILLHRSAQAGGCCRLVRSADGRCAALTAAAGVASGMQYALAADWTVLEQLAALEEDGEHLGGD